MTQQVVFGSEAHQQLLEGAEILYKAVKSTMGPGGRGVIIDNEKMAPIITKDGVTVARSINLKNKLQAVGAELLKEVAAKTNELSGDGTTTATVLGYCLLHHGHRTALTGRNSVELKRGMDKACRWIVDWLNQHAVKVVTQSDMVNVGTISANGDREIGELLTQAILEVGQDGIITIEPAKSVKTTLDVIEGMQIDAGFSSPYFITNQEKLVCELNEPLVLVTNKNITQLKDIVNVLESVASSKKSLLIVAEDVEGEALHTLIVNKMKGVLPSCVVKVPSVGSTRLDTLQDIAALTGSTVIDSSSEHGLSTVGLSHLGKCKKVLVYRNKTCLIGGSLTSTEAIATKTESVKQAMLLTADESLKEYLKKRLSRLAGGVAVVKVGGVTEIEILEKRDRVEDALNSTLSAVQEGILPGGGAALLNASEACRQWFKTHPEELTDDELSGVWVVCEATKEPFKTIVENSGKNFEVIITKLKSMKENNTEQASELGYDSYNHVYCNLIEKGIIDPLKVERCALEHAVSVAGLMLMSSAVVINDDNNTNEPTNTR